VSGSSFSFFEGLRLNRLAINQLEAIGSSGKSLALPTLALTSLADALHDAFTDMIYVPLLIWQAELVLDYVALAVLLALYVGVLAHSKCRLHISHDI